MSFKWALGSPSEFPPNGPVHGEPHDDTKGGDRVETLTPTPQSLPGWLHSFVCPWVIFKKRGTWSFFLRLHINPPVWSWWVSVHHWPGSQPSMCLHVFHPLISSEVHWGPQGMMFGLLPLPWKYAPAAPHSGKMDDTCIPVNLKTCRLKRSRPSWPQMCEKPILTVYVLEMFEVACYTALHSNKAADWDMG